MWQDLKSRALNKLTFNSNLTGNSEAKEKKLTQWEKRITDFLVKADSDVISGLHGGFETGMTILSLQDEQAEIAIAAEESQEDAASADMFSIAGSQEADLVSFSLDLPEPSDDEGNILLTQTESTALPVQ